jgi:hypothetical protein
MEEYFKVWSLHNLRLGISRGHFSFTVTVLFALNRLFFRDLFLENWEPSSGLLNNEFLLRFSGIVVLFLVTLLIALFIHLWRFVLFYYQDIHRSLITGRDQLFTYKKLYSIVWPMKFYIFLGTLCYYTIKYPKLKYSLYLAGFFYFVMYCFTGFATYFLIFWLMSCCQKYCKYTILLKHPKGVLTLTESEYWGSI